MNSLEIDNNGSWLTDDPQHSFDNGLNSRLLNLLKNKSVFDFGCGDASYLKHLKNICTEVRGCDGNPFTEQLTDGIGFVVPPPPLFSASLPTIF